MLPGGLCSQKYIGGLITIRVICSKIEYEQQNDPWNVERFLEDLLLVVNGQSILDIDCYL